VNDVRNESDLSNGYPDLHPAHFLMSCDFRGCQEEGGHYCLLHSVQIKNMDTVACPDWTEKDNAHLSGAVSASDQSDCWQNGGKQ